jgi:hypothetical protein
LGHPLRVLHAIASLLAIVMAWLWNGVLTAIAASPAEVVTGRGAVRSPVPFQVQRTGRFGRWSQTGGPALSQTFDSSEEKEGGESLTLASLPSPTHGPAVAIAADAPHAMPTRGPAPPTARPRPLRC